MSNNDLIGLIASYAYATGILLVASLALQLFHIKADLTRKFIHISAGMWVFGVLALFDHWLISIIPFATFIPLNYLLYRYRLIRAMDTKESSPGTVYFAISVTLLFVLLGQPNNPIDGTPIAVAGIMAMTWGDASAALVGQQFGQHRYQIWGSERSWEGSAAMLIASTGAMFAVLWLLPGETSSPLPFNIINTLLTALLAGIAATIVEAISPHGTDNLSVPLVAAAVIWIIAQGNSLIF